MGYFLKNGSEKMGIIGHNTHETKTMPTHRVLIGNSMKNLCYYLVEKFNFSNLGIVEKTLIVVEIQ